MSKKHKINPITPMSRLLLWHSKVDAYFAHDESHLKQDETLDDLLLELLCLMLDSSEVYNIVQRDWDVTWTGEERIGTSMITQSDVLFHIVGRDRLRDESFYNDKAKDILWEYVSKNDIPEIEKRLAEIEGGNQ